MSGLSGYKAAEPLFKQLLLTHKHKTVFRLTFMKSDMSTGFIYLEYSPTDQLVTAKGQ
jgi:hypothetical protein